MDASNWRRSRRRAAAVIAVFTVLVAACGSDNGSNAGDTSTSAATTAAATAAAATTAAATTTTVATTAAATTTTVAKPTGAPIKLMTVYEKDQGVPNPEIPEGAIAAAKAINNKGGIKGRPVEIIECDTKNDPNTAAECGRKAVDEGVIANVGNLSVHSGQFMPLLADNRIPSIGLTPASAPDFISPASFPIAGGAPVVLAGLGAALVEGGATKVAVARIDIAAGAALPQFVGAGLKQFNQTVAKDVPVPAGAPDMSTYAAAALSDGTDGIVVGLPAQDAINFVQAVRQSKPDVGIAMTATEIGNVLDALGTNAEGIYQSSSLTTALKNTAEKQYEADMKAAGYDELTGFRLNSYASVLVFAEVAKDLPDITGPAVFEALGKVKDLDVGLTAPLQFSQGVGGLPRVFNPCLFTTSIKSGQQTPVAGKFKDAYTGQECPTPT